MKNTFRFFKLWYSHRWDGYIHTTNYFLLGVFTSMKATGKEPVQRLFSPGPVPAEYKTELTFSHRSHEFKQLFEDVQHQLVSLSGYRNVAFVQGSASSAIETVLSSVLHADSRLLILINGEFARRASEMAAFYTKHITPVNDIATLESRLLEEDFDFCFVVQFETSLSIFNNLKRVEELCLERGVHLLADTVSAFPFYEPPKAKIMLSTSSKQLRGLPAMGLIFFNDLEDISLIERSDYLNLKRYIKYAKEKQTPHTSLIPQFDSLRLSLQNFDLLEHRAVMRRNALALTAGLENAILNDPICPVVTIKVKEAERLVSNLSARGISVYHNFYYMNYYIQVGCFNYADSAVYAELNAYLKTQMPLLEVEGISG